MSPARWCSQAYIWNYNNRRFIACRSRFSPIKCNKRPADALRSPAKAAALGALFERLLRGVEGGGRLPGDETKSNGEVRGGDETLLWTRFCTAQHADHLGDTGLLPALSAVYKD